MWRRQWWKTDFDMITASLLEFSYKNPVAKFTEFVRKKTWPNNYATELITCFFLVNIFHSLWCTFLQSGDLIGYSFTVLTFWLVTENKKEKNMKNIYVIGRLCFLPTNFIWKLCRKQILFSSCVLISVLMYLSIWKGKKALPWPRLVITSLSLSQHQVMFITVKWISWYYIVYLRSINNKQQITQLARQVINSFNWLHNEAL